MQVQRVNHKWIGLLAQLGGEPHDMGDYIEYRLRASDILDLLQVPSDCRNTDTGRQLAATMRHLGWGLKNIRVGDEVVRGYVHQGLKDDGEPIPPKPRPAAVPRRATTPNRPRLMSLRLTVGEAAALDAVSTKTGMTPSAVIRHLILTAHKNLA